MTKLFKFEVGQFVALVSDNPMGQDGKATYHIIERSLQECPAGAQVWYTCRGHHSKYRERSVTLQLIKFNEIELEECQQPEEGTTATLKQQVVKLLDEVEAQERKKGPEKKDP